MLPDAKAIARSAKKRPLFTPGPSTARVDLGRAAIERLLPHRDPFLFVDRPLQLRRAPLLLLIHQSPNSRDPLLHRQVQSPDVLRPRFSEDLLLARRRLDGPHLRW